MISQQKLAKHKLTLDRKRSKIRKLNDLSDEGLYCGEVSGFGDNGLHIAFVIRDGKILLSDCEEKSKSKFNYEFDLQRLTYSGIGTVNYYRDCERFVAYVLLLLQMMD